jgi:hypothetical protein
VIAKNFYLHRLQLTNPGVLPDDAEDLEASIADGPSDAGVDFLARVDGHVLIIQAKYRRSGKIENPEDFEYFCNVLSRLHSTKGSEYKISARVRELSSEIDWERDTFDLHFITLGRANDNIRARENDGQNSVYNLPGIEERVEITFYDESLLNQLLREAATASEQILQPIKRSQGSARTSPRTPASSALSPRRSGL